MKHREDNSLSIQYISAVYIIYIDHSFVRSTRIPATPTSVRSDTPRRRGPGLPPRLREMLRLVFRLFCSDEQRFHQLVAEGEAAPAKNSPTHRGARVTGRRCGQ